MTRVSRYITKFKENCPDPYPCVQTEWNVATYIARGSPYIRRLSISSSLWAIVDIYFVNYCNIFNIQSNGYMCDLLWEKGQNNKFSKYPKVGNFHYCTPQTQSSLSIKKKPAFLRVGHIRHRIWINPAYGIIAQFAQCAFFRSKIMKVQILSYPCLRILTFTVVYEGWM